MIKGITVILKKKTQVGTDGFNRPVYDTIDVAVENVLVAPVNTDDLPAPIDLTGKKAVYQLGIPKGDMNNWEDCDVEFSGKTWHSFGFTTEGIDVNIPLAWNKKVLVELYG